MNRPPIVAEDAMQQLVVDLRAALLRLSRAAEEIDAFSLDAADALTNYLEATGEREVAR